MQAAFTIDLENPELGGVEGARLFLDWLDAESVRATFFTVAELALDHRGLLEDILARGHEIACHGLNHPAVDQSPEDRTPFLTELSDTQFDEGLAEAKRLLTINGVPPRGFRAPWLRINRQKRLILAKHFAYDSSCTNAREHVAIQGLADLPVSAASGVGPQMSSSVLLGLPDAIVTPLISCAVSRLKPDQPFVLYTHSFDPVQLTRPVKTALWKRWHYYDRCGPTALQAASRWLAGLRKHGAEFVRLCDVVSKSGSHGQESAKS